jgi:hypothetical protein
MRIIAIGMLAVLCGCQTPEDLQRTVGNASNYQLCRAIMLAPAQVADIARGEAARRSLDCAPYAGLVLQGQQAQDAAGNQALQNLLRPAPPPRQMTSCRSYWLGNQLQTDCN